MWTVKGRPIARAQIGSAINHYSSGARSNYAQHYTASLGIGRRLFSATASTHFPGDSSPPSDDGVDKKEAQKRAEEQEQTQELMDRDRDEELLMEEGEEGGEEGDYYEGDEYDDEYEDYDDDYYDDEEEEYEVDERGRAVLQDPRLRSIEELEERPALHFWPTKKYYKGVHDTLGEEEEEGEGEEGEEGEGEEGEHAQAAEGEEGAVEEEDEDEDEYEDEDEENELNEDPHTDPDIETTTFTSIIEAPPSFESIDQLLALLERFDVFEERHSKIMRPMLESIQQEEAVIKQTLATARNEASPEIAAYLAKFRDLGDNFAQQESEWDPNFLRTLKSRLAAMIPRKALRATEVEPSSKLKELSRKESFEFAPGFMVPIGGYFELSSEDEVAHLKEGIAESFVKESIEFNKDRKMLFRPVTLEVIKDLTQRQATNFEAANQPGIVLSGESGTGKSVVITQLVLWARKNGWLVVHLPDARKLSMGTKINTSRVEDNCFDQHDLARALANQFLKAHGDQFRTIPLRTQTHLRGFNRTPQSTLADLLQYAANPKNEQATDALHLFRRDLNRITEFPVLIAIDNYNAMYGTSDFFTPEDVSRGRVRSLPAQRLTIAKMFSNHQDHGLINGAMVCALTNTKAPVKWYRQAFGEDFAKRTVNVPNYSLDEFSECIRHTILSGHNREPISVGTEKYLFQLTAGNPADLVSILATQ